MGAEVIELERHFNNQRGSTARTLFPYDLPDFESAMSEYYDERGWSDDGTVPEPSGVASVDD